MAGDRLNDLSPKIRLTPQDLIPGRSFTTQRKGFPEARVVFHDTKMGVDKKRGGERLEAILYNPATGKYFGARLDRVLGGQIGQSRITSMEVMETPGEVFVMGYQSAVEPKISIPELGTDMVAISFRESPEDQTLAVVSGIEDGNMALLGLPETPDIQLLRVPKEDLLNGGNEDFILNPVDPKFSLLKEAPELERRAAEADIVGGPSLEVNIVTGAVDQTTVCVCPDYKLADESPEFTHAEGSPYGEILAKQIDTSAKEGIMERRRGKRGRLDRILNALWDIRVGSEEVMQDVRSISFNGVQSEEKLKI